ncbi:hypothetical protein BX600DRAFT_482825 [Xylariales sp. PMI_506]|nr:hypothetical protein BX600DRAFT_482825 [Xylariales sp. PMI_506]
MGSIDPRVAIITGATSGIGHDLAKHLHSRGWKVALTGRRVELGERLTKEIDPTGETAIFLECDVASYAAQAKVFQQVWGKWQRLDALIPNAGTVDMSSLYNFRRRGAAIDDIPPEPYLGCTDVDYKGVIYGTVLATHFMRHNKAPGGKIVITGSIIGIHPCPTFPEYCGVKAGVVQFARAIAPLLLSKDNITINVVMPGGTDTGAMPDFAVAFRPEHLTLTSSLMAAYDIFLDDAANEKTGQALEAAHDKHYFYDIPELKGGEVTDRSTRAYEPWFALMHGEKSELPNALKVTGATGSQGGGVVNVMKKTPGWKVRAVTRNPESESAKKLAAEGVEVVQASFDDEASLVKAFEGVSAVYAVTNWWEHVFSGKSQHEAGVIEEEQGMNVARAAAKTPTMEHYIWSTTPSAKRMLKGELETPHMDYKANVDERIKNELPELAAKTTYLYLGYYPQKLAFFPFLRPIEYPQNGQYIQVIPTNPNAKILLSGDMTVNPGIWVRQALATGKPSFGKYANVALEKWTFKEMLDVWGEITGKKGVVVECSIEAYTALWGAPGNELGLQFKFGELCDPWVVTADHISPEDLGIDPNEVVGFRGTIEGLKALF